MGNSKLEKAVSAFKKGDANAFDIIYDETKVAVYYTILRIVKDESRAEDIMQDTYMTMLEKIHSYEPRQKFQAWMTVIARNKALNQYKKNQREQLVDIQESSYMFESTDSDAEKKYYVQSLLEILDEEEKEIVIRHVLLNHKHKDIAKALNKPLGTVLWKYRRALKKIKNEGGVSDERNH